MNSNSMDRIEELSHALSRLPGIGPRQAKRFVFFMLSMPLSERTRLAGLISALEKDVMQCIECFRFSNGGNSLCSYCANSARNDTQLMLVEKDQDLTAIERAGTYKGRYFVLGGVLTLSGKGFIRENEMLQVIEMRISRGLKEVVLALSATSEGEHTADHVRDLLKPYRENLSISLLGRGLATGSELEYSDAETLRAALAGRKEL